MREVPSCYSFHVDNSALECLLEFIAKQVPYPLGLYLKQELSVKTLWHDTKMMVSPSKWRVHFATSVPKSQSASLSHLRIEKLEDELHLLESFVHKATRNLPRMRC